MADHILEMAEQDYFIIIVSQNNIAKIRRIIIFFFKNFN